MEPLIQHLPQGGGSEIKVIIGHASESVAWLPTRLTSPSDQRYSKVLYEFPSGSSSPHRLVGLGHRPFTAVTGVRIPLGTPDLLLPLERARTGERRRALRRFQIPLSRRSRRQGKKRIVFASCSQWKRYSRS